MSSNNFLGLEKDVMPIGGYIAPSPKMNDSDYDLITDEIFKDVFDCGLNFLDSLSIDFDKYNDAFIKQLVLAEKHGIKMLVGEANNIFNQNFNEEEFIKSINRYAKMPAFVGIHGKDEPLAKDMENVNKRKELFKKFFPDKEFFMNFLPNYAKPDFLCDKENVKDKYEFYVDKALSVFKLDYFCYDYYPFVGKFPNFLGGYFANLALVASKTVQKNIAFFTCIQSTSWNEDYARYVTKEEMDFLVKSSLAFGAKGIVYFSYAVPVVELPENEVFKEAIIDKKGNKTERFEFAKSNNLHIKSVQKILMNCAFKGVMVCGSSVDELPKDLILNEFREVRKISGKHFVAGCFDYSGKTVVYVFNNSITETATLSIIFDKSREFNCYLDENMKTILGQNTSIVLTAGNGCLIELVN